MATESGENENTTPEQGGIGGNLFARGRVSERSEAAMIRRAIREGWPIKPEIRAMVVNQMALIVGRSEDERNKIAASKVLVAADGVNVNREKLDHDKEADAAALQESVAWRMFAGGIPDGPLPAAVEDEIAGLVPEMPEKKIEPVPSPPSRNGRNGDGH